MSKRFGRNQKRKLREKIARLELEARGYVYLLEEERSATKSARADGANDRIALAHIIESISRICPESVLIPAGSRVSFAHVDPAQQRIRIGLSRNVDVTGYPFDESVVTATQTSIDMHRLDSFIEKDHVQFGWYVHANFGCLSSACSFVSAQGFMERNPVDQALWARQIAEGLIDHIHSDLGRKARKPTPKRRRAVW
jgi:hypothetical protein